MATGRRAETGTAPRAGDPFHASFLDGDSGLGRDNRYTIHMVMIATDFTEFSTSLENGMDRISTPLSMSQTHGRVAELVDALVLGTSGVTRESSSLSLPTKHTTTGRHS